MTQTIGGPDHLGAEPGRTRDHVVSVSSSSEAMDGLRLLVTWHRVEGVLGK